MKQGTLWTACALHNHKSYFMQYQRIKIAIKHKYFINITANQTKSLTQYQKTFSMEQKNNEYPTPTTIP